MNTLEAPVSQEVWPVLAQNDIAMYIAAHLPDTNPNWTEIVEVYKNIDFFKKKNPTWSTITSLLSEIYLNQSIEKLGNIFEGAHVKLDPIPSGARVGDIVFSSFRGRFCAFRLPEDHVNNNHIYRTENTIAEYDALAEIDKIPVVFEEKLKRHRNGGGMGSKRLKDSLKPHEISKKVEPVRNYYMASRGIADCGYVLVVSQESYSLESTLQQAAIAHGVIIVPFYTTQEEFEKEALQAFKERKLIG